MQPKLLRLPFASALLLLLFAGCTLSAWGATPPNDRFADRQVLTGRQTFFEGDLTGAALEAGEPEHPIPQWIEQGSAKRSIWWQWTAPAKGGIRLDARASTFFRKGIYIYRGESLETLSLVSSSYGDEMAQANVEAGVTYFICLGSGADQGHIIVSLRHYDTAPDDNFANRTVISGTRVTVPLNLFGTTVEANEPGEGSPFAPPFGNGAWWEWTAPRDGTLTVYNDGCAMEAFQGSSLSDLEPYPGIFGATHVSAGQRIFIRCSIPPGTQRGLYDLSITLDGAQFVSPRGGTYGVGQSIPIEIAFADTDEAVRQVDFYQLVHCESFTGEVLQTLTEPPWRIDWRPTNAFDFRASARIVYVSGREQYLASDCFQARNTPPSNDNRVDAVVIEPGGGVADISSLLGATLEAGEENLWGDVFSGLGSAWWKWTPSQSGPAAIMAPPETVLRIFKGQNMDGVSIIWAAALARFNVVSNEAYWIGLRPASGYAKTTDQLNVSIGSSTFLPPNDDFAGRLPLSGSGQLSADLTFATRESGEPGTGDSLWWNWSAAESGLLEIEATSASELILQIASTEVMPYRGSTLTGLTPVAVQYGTWPDQSGRFRVSAGEQIALRLAHSISSSDRHAFLRYRFLPDPANDLFTNRVELNGFPVVLRTHFSSASWREPNEPQPFNLPRSQWWTWTSPYRGQVGVAIHGITATLRLAIFEGTELSSLTQIHAITNQAGLLLFVAEEGRTYEFQVNGATDTEFILHLSSGEPNDNFADSIALTSQNWFIAANNLNATHEAGERTRVPGPPPFTTLPLSGSLWWHFTPSVDGQLTLRHQPFLWVYRDQWVGDGVDSLQPLKLESYTDGAWISTKMKVEQGRTIYVSLDTLADTLSADPIPQSMLLEHEFTSLRLVRPQTGAEFNAQAKIDFAVGPILSEFDGEINSVALRFGKQRPDGTFEYQTSPHGWVTRLAGPPFVHSISNWPAGIYEVTARAVNSTGDLRVSAPEFFIIGPANDHFTNRLTVNLGRTTIETLGGTSLEPFETNFFAGIKGSAWWEWKAPWSGPAFVENPNAVAVYHGTNENSLRIITNAAGNVSFFAERDEIYQIALLRAGGDTNVGPVSFTVSLAPEGDDFANRRRLLLYEGPPSVFSNEQQFEARHASLEEGEVDHGVADVTGSVWWEFTVAHAGTFAAGYSGSGGSEVRLYRGAGFGELVPVALSAIDEFFAGAELEAGVYQVAIVTRTNAANFSGRLYLSFRSAAPNDDFANATIVDGTFGRVDTPFWFGTVEPAEPHPFWFPAEIPQSSQVPLIQTLWWKWTAPRRGNLDIVIPEHLSLTFWPQFKVDLFEGDTLATLQVVPKRSEYRVPLYDDTIVDFEVTQGKTYYIRAGLGNEFNQGGMFSFLFALSDGVVTNDVLRNARVLEVSPIRVEGHTAGAREGFLYYNWHPSEEGLAFFESASSNIYISVACYDAQSNLVSNALIPPKSALHARAGETFRIAVFGYTPVPFEFTVNLLPGRPNDDYASRQILTGTSGAFFADALYSSGTFGVNGEATTIRTLYYEWIAPHAGQLIFENLDGTPASQSIGISEMGGAFGVTRIIAGRTYLISFVGLEPRSFRYRLEAEEFVPQLASSGGNLHFFLDGPSNAIVRIEVSDDLTGWTDLGLFESTHGTIALANEPTGAGKRFFRLTPVW